MNAQDHARFQSLYQRYLTEFTLRQVSGCSLVARGCSLVIPCLLLVLRSRMGSLEDKQQ
jgi:hypothetical protein